MQMRKTSHGSEFVSEKVTIHKAIYEIYDCLTVGAFFKLIHPIGILRMTLNGGTYLPSMTHSTKTVQKNCKALRNFIEAYVNKRKRGEVQSRVSNMDLLTLFLQSPDIFTDEFIIDELMDFFLAGV